MSKDLLVKTLGYLADFNTPKPDLLQENSISIQASTNTQ